MDTLGAMEILIILAVLVGLFYPTYYLAKKNELSLGWNILGTVIFGPLWWIVMFFSKKGTKLIAIPIAIFSIVVIGILASVAIPKLAGMASSGTPKCSDPETVQLVKQIISDNQMLVAILEKNKMEDLNLDLIRTVDKDEESEMYTCKAKLDFGENVIENPILATAFSNITYTVAMTDDKKQFVVELISK